MRLVDHSVLLHFLKACLHGRLLHSFIDLLYLLLQFVLVFTIDQGLLVLILILNYRFLFLLVRQLVLRANFSLIRWRSASLRSLVLVSFLDDLLVLLVARLRDFGRALNGLDVFSLFQAALSSAFRSVVVRFTALFLTSLPFLVYFHLGSLRTFVLNLLLLLCRILHSLLALAGPALGTWCRCGARFLHEFHFFSFLLSLLHLLLLAKHFFVHFDLLDVTAVSAPAPNDRGRTELWSLLSFLVQPEDFVDDGSPLLRSLDLIYLALLSGDYCCQFSLVDASVLDLRAVDIHVLLQHLRQLVLELSILWLATVRLRSLSLFLCIACWFLCHLVALLLFANRRARGSRSCRLLFLLLFGVGGRWSNGLLSSLFV